MRAADVGEADAAAIGAAGAAAIGGAGAQALGGVEGGAGGARSDARRAPAPRSSAARRRPASAPRAAPPGPTGRRARRARRRAAEPLLERFELRQDLGQRLARLERRHLQQRRLEVDERLRAVAHRPGRFRGELEQPQQVVLAPRPALLLQPLEVLARQRHQVARLRVHLEHQDVADVLAQPLGQVARVQALLERLVQRPQRRLRVALERPRPRW